MKQEHTAQEICPYSKTLPKQGKKCPECWCYQYEDCLKALTEDHELEAKDWI
jgi:hypothetical protein